MNRPNHGGNLNWAAALVGCPASLIIDFSASINPLGPPQSAIAAITQSLHSITHYPDPDYTQLRLALAQWHHLPLDWILPGNGTAELLTWASRELSQQEIIYLLTPAFGDYSRAIQTFNGKIQPCLLDINRGKWSISRKNCETAGLLLNNPHNPTGHLFSQEQILPYLDTFSLVVIDEAFMDFLPPHQQQSLIPLVADFPNLVILRSLTKFYSLPGLRFGYAIAHPDRLRKWQQWRDPWPVNTLAIAAAEAVIQDRDFQQKTWDWLLPARKQLYQGLTNISGLQPLKSSTNFLLVGSQIPSSQLQEQLLKRHHILIRDCLSFPELGEGYFRIAVRSSQDNQRLLEALYSEQLLVNSE